MKWLKFILPQNVFLIIALTFGILFQLNTPPFQSPDEFNHFYRSYQIADGQWEPLNFEKRLGGYVPESFVDIQDIFVSQRYNFYTLDPEEIKERNKIPLNESRKVFVDFPNTALYSPTSYIPQAAAIYICSKLEVSSITMLYFARFCTFLFWMFFIYVSIRIIPIYKWLFTFLALIPMSVFINGTLSADVVTNALSFATIAFSLYCAFKVEKFTYRHLLIFLLLACALALSKLIYAGLILLFFLVPMTKFKNRKFYFLSFCLILVTAVISGRLWTDTIFGHYIPFPEYNKGFGQYLDLPARAHILAHKIYIANNPMYFLDVLTNTFLYSSDMYIPSYIAALGCLEVYPPTWCYYACYTLIIFLALFETNDRFKFSYSQKLTLFLTAISLFTLLVYSQHVSFDYIGEKKADVIQGRYLIPIFPLAFFLLNQSKVKISKWFYLMPFIICVITLYLCYIALGKRYIYHMKKQVTSVIWNNPKVLKEKHLKYGKHFITNVNDTAIKAITPAYFKTFYNLADTNLLARDTFFKSDGILKLHFRNQYACTFKYYGAKKGDLVYAEMSRKGGNCQIILSTDTIDRLFLGSHLPLYRDQEGWVKIRMFYTLKHDYNKSPVNMFLWHNAENDTSRIKNFKITISRVGFKNQE
jgi:uncharacterized membrane protein